MTNIEGAGLASLKRFKEDSGLSTKEIAKLIKRSPNTIDQWLSNSGRNPPHDGFLELAVEAARSKYSAQKNKQNISEEPKCPFCGELFRLNEIGRGKFMVSHLCRSGMTIKMPERPKDEMLYALTPLMRS